MITAAHFSDVAPFLSAGDLAEAYIEQSEALSLHWEEGRVDSSSRVTDYGVGLRYLNQQETHFGSISGKYDRSQLMRLSHHLTYGWPLLKAKNYIVPAVKRHSYSIDPTHISLDKKAHLLKTLADAANWGPHIRQIEINYGEKKKMFGVLNSFGECVLEERIYCVLSLRVTVARGKDLQTAYESVGGVVGYEIFEKNRLIPLAKTVSERAHQKLNAPQAPAGEMPVVIASSAGGTLIHEAIGHSLEADAVYEGSSPAYLGKLGAQVGHEKLTVLDNPLVVGARGSFFYDDEGLPSQSTVLIENGVLKNYLFDRLSARKAGVPSNGHGRRESYRHKPLPRMSNTYVAPGHDDPAAIVNGLRDGFLVTKMGGGQVNPVNGDFVFEVEEGYHVVNGERILVRGATLLGNGPQLLFDIDQVGSDHGWAIGTCGKEGQGVPVSDALPTVRVQKMVIGGAAEI